MGDFIGIIALLVLYIIASSTGKKKKKKAAENTQSKSVQNKKAPPKKKAKDSSKPASQNKRSADVYQPITPDFPEIQVQSQDFEPHEDHDEGRQAFAKDIMRGVIMNEILTRPNEREAIRRMRQRR